MKKLYVSFSLDPPPGHRRGGGGAHTRNHIGEDQKKKSLHSSI